MSTLTTAAWGCGERLIDKPVRDLGRGRDLRGADAGPRADQTVPCAAQLTHRDNEVLAAILAHLTAKPACSGAAWKEMILVDTISPSAWTSERPRVAPFIKPLNPPVAAVDSFICRNSHTVKIVTPPPSTVPLQLIAPSAIGSIEALMSKYPNAGALVGLSLPGYDASFTTAVVYYYRTCSSLGGQGFYALLTAGPGGWRIVKTTPLWIS